MDDEIKLIERVHGLHEPDSDVESADEVVYDEDFESLRPPSVPIYQQRENIVVIFVFLTKHRNRLPIIPNEKNRGANVRPVNSKKRLTKNERKQILPQPHPTVEKEDVNETDAEHNADSEPQTDHNQNLQEKFAPSYADAVKILGPALQLRPAQQQQPINGMLNFGNLD